SDPGLSYLLQLSPHRGRHSGQNKSERVAGELRGRRGARFYIGEYAAGAAAVNFGVRRLVAAFSCGATRRPDQSADKSAHSIEIRMPLLKPTILRFDSIDSTNLEAIRQARAGAPEGLCVMAREQTQGRGRLD